MQITNQREPVYKNFFECKRNIIPALWVVVGFVDIVLAMTVTHTKELFERGFLICMISATIGLLVNLFFPPSIKEDQNDKESTND